MLNQSAVFINLLITFLMIYGGIKNINIFYDFLYNFYIFLNENNPLVIDYSDYSNNDELKEIDIQKPIDKKPEPIYDDKYLEKFKNFPNEFKFSDLELELERKHFELIKNNMEKNLLFNKSKIEEKLLKIKEICEKGYFEDEINDFGKEALISYFELDDEDEDEDEDIDFEELNLDLIVEKVKLEEEMTKLNNIIINDDEIKAEALQFIINKKLDTCMDNYVLECTPLGNIYMRYNNSKKSFEYFSNNTIPYRYLEPVGRKYVMTYWCKPIFVDIEEELKKSEEKYQEEMKKMSEEKNNESEEIKNKVSKLKSYTKENSIKMTRAPSKNRGAAGMSLPPQFKANLPNINSTSEKILLKENANRYTWEGRLSNFSPLKKIDKKVVNKNLSLSFADFKKMQKNKK